MTLHIFSYGSNLLLARLKARVPSARFIGKAVLPGHVLRWHKPGSDGSGKCDAFQTGDPADLLWGGIFAIDRAHKHFLDAAEGLGTGYDEKYADIECSPVGRAPFVIRASLYTALKIDDTAIPYSWYKGYVVAGAHECGLPSHHIDNLQAMDCRQDANTGRDAQNRAVLPDPFSQISERSTHFCKTGAS